jgi:integrase
MLLNKHGGRLNAAFLMKGWIEMARRKGLPAIRQRKDRNGKKLDVWEALLNLGRDPGTGKLKRVPVYGKTQDECRQKLIKALGEVQNNTFVIPTKLTLGEWMNIWLMEYKVNNKKIRPTTRTSYEYLIRVHIKKDLGAAILTDLKPEQVQHFYNSKVDAGLSGRTVHYIHVILSGALDQAVKLGKVSRNVAKLTELPKQEKPEMRVLTVDEQNKFMAAILNDRLGMLFLLDLATGLRRGELLALKWNDVNLKEKYIKVTHSVTRVRNFDGEGTKTKLLTQDPKTEKGKRVIPLMDNIVTALKEYKTAETDKFKFLEWDDLKIKQHLKDELVFTNELGGLIEPRNLNRTFYRLIDKAGIDKANLHSLRHTFATRGVESGMQLIVMRDLLGHENVSTTDRYSHALMDAKREAMAKMNNLFTDKGSKHAEPHNADFGQDVVTNVVAFSNN